MSIRATSDAGNPVVESEPDGPHAAIYRAIGERIRDQLRGATAAA
jgi:ATP-binding protein involved in chromosome partitioning